MSQISWASRFARHWAGSNHSPRLLFTSPLREHKPRPRALLHGTTSSSPLGLSAHSSYWAKAGIARIAGETPELDASRSRRLGVVRRPLAGTK